MPAASVPPGIDQDYLAKAAAMDCVRTAKTGKISGFQ
jgi:hypothetical protein